MFRPRIVTVLDQAVRPPVEALGLIVRSKGRERKEMECQLNWERGY